MKKTFLALVAVFFLAANAYAQTPTPTNTPTDTPTPTVTPTPTLTPTPTPILTNPFRFDNLQTKVETWLGITQSQAPLAPSNDGRMIYDTGVQDFMCSKNGGAYAACAPTPAATPTAITPSSCPAGSDTDIQFNDGGSTCGGESQFIYLKDAVGPLTRPAVEMITAHAGNIPTIEFGNTSNTAGSGSLLLMFSGGLTADGGNTMVFDRGASDAVPRYFEIYHRPGTGILYFAKTGSPPSQPAGGNTLLILDPTVHQVRVATGSGSDTSPDLAFVDDQTTGFSRTSDVPPNEVDFNWIAHSNRMAHVSWNNDTSKHFYVDQRFDATPFIVNTGNATESVSVDAAYINFTSTRGAGTDVTLDAITGTHDGQWVRLANAGTNPITFTASANQKTLGGALQTLNHYDFIEFSFVVDSWVQMGPVGGPSGGGGSLKTAPVAVGSLPTCNAASEGTHAAVNNSNAASYTAGIGTVVAAGGATHVPVYCDGTNWLIG